MPNPSMSPQSHELVQYGQSMGNPQRPLRQHEVANQRFNTQQFEDSEPRPHYDIQDLFNG